MPWLPPSIIATLSGTTILVAVYTYLYFLDREKALGIWALSWAVYALRFTFMLVMVYGGASSTLVIANQTASLASGILLLWGTYAFLNRPLPRIWAGIGFIGTLWIVLSVGLEFSFMTMALPTFILLAAVYGLTGMVLLRARPDRGLGYRITGWMFILWGIHKADYPFLRPVGWFAPWGYLLGALLAFAVALSVLLVYFQTARDNLAESEERFRQLAENINEVFWLVSIDWQSVYYISPAYETVWGRSRASLYQAPRSWLDAVVVQDRALVRSVISERAPQDTSPLVFPPHRIQRPDGSLRWILTRGFPVVDAQGVVYRMVGIAEDITQRKATEDALKESETLYRTLFQSTPDAISITRTTDGTYRYVNDGFRQVSGYDRKEVIGRTSLNLGFFVDPADRDKFLQILAQKGEVRDFEIKYRIKDGTILDTVLSANKIQYDGEDCLLAVVKDISAVKRAEADRRKLEVELQKARKQETVGRLAGGIAHDFNNLLSLILGNAELAQEDLPPDSPVIESLEEITTAGLRARDVVRQLLSFTRNDFLEKAPQSLAAIVRDAADLLRASTPSSIDIQYRMDDGVAAVLAAPSQIKEVLIHLCTNACHAMEETGGTLEIGVRNLEETRSQQVPPGSGPQVELWVSDTGHGIEEAHLDRIFDPYFTTKEVNKGSGMGLAVVQGVVRQHGGRVLVQRRPRGGTVFRIHLPALSGQGEKQEQPSADLPTGTERILLVDDEPSMVKMGTAALSRLGYQVIGRTDPGEALNLFQGDPGRFDLVITDMTMPVMTGDRLARALLEIRPDLPIVLCTGYSERMDRDKASAAGISAFLEKPLERKNLAQALRMALNKK